MRCQGGTQKLSSRHRIVAQKHGALTPRIQSTAAPPREEFALGVVQRGELVQD